MRYISLTILCFILTSFTPNSNKTSLDHKPIEELFSLMQGSFNSEKQATEDPSYYNITLHMYPIWDKKGHFLYVEQSVTSMQDKPYRQRIYELKENENGSISSYVYTIPNDSVWIGKWKTPEAFNSLTHEDLVLRNGCEVVLNRVTENRYKGKTGETSCESSLRGASYATSEVEIDSEKIVSWDRGFDAEGNQVWGAEKAGYIFNKLNN